MQDFIDQAHKNGVTLLENGKCQFCGEDYQRGIFECMDNYNNGLELLDFNVEENHLFRFLSVDAHALQHPEIHGRWSIEVYQAWSSNHLLVSQIAEGFLEKNNHHQTHDSKKMNR